ncbi:Zinc finger CCCH domain-containing protein 13-like isoform X1 [Balamuthia mandrillaris]
MIKRTVSRSRGGEEEESIYIPQMDFMKAANMRKTYTTISADKKSSLLEKHYKPLWAILIALLLIGPYIYMKSQGATSALTAPPSPTTAAKTTNVGADERRIGGETELGEGDDKGEDVKKEMNSFAELLYYPRRAPKSLFNEQQSEQLETENVDAATEEADKLKKLRDLEKEREKERAKELELERERQRELEQEREREKLREKERERLRELDLKKEKELQKQRQMLLEKKLQDEREAKERLLKEEAERRSKAEEELQKAKEDLERARQRELELLEQMKQKQLEEEEQAKQKAAENGVHIGKEENEKGNEDEGEEEEEAVDETYYYEEGEEQEEEVAKNPFSALKPEKEEVAVSGPVTISKRGKLPSKGGAGGAKDKKKLIMKSSMKKKVKEREKRVFTEVSKNPLLTQPSKGGIGQELFRFQAKRKYVY